MKTLHVDFSILFLMQHLMLCQLNQDSTDVISNFHLNDTHVSTNSTIDHNVEKEDDIIKKISLYWCIDEVLPETMIDSVYECFREAFGDFGYLLQLKCENELFPVTSMSKNDVRKIICKNDSNDSKKLSNCYAKYSKKAIEWLNRKFTSSRRKAKINRPVQKKASTANMDEKAEKNNESMDNDWKKNSQLLVSNKCHP